MIDENYRRLDMHATDSRRLLSQVTESVNSAMMELQEELRKCNAKLAAIREVVDNTASVDFDEMPMTIRHILDGKS